MDKAEILLNELVKEAEAYEQKCQKEFAIKELEHLKNEIKNLLILNEAMFEDLDDLESLLTIIDKIYNKQIAKLEDSNG